MGGRTLRRGPRPGGAPTTNPVGGRTLRRATRPGGPKTKTRGGNMLRRILLAVLSAGLVVGGAVAAPEMASAAKPTITANGNANCSITGKVKISPPLTNQNTVPSNITGKLKGTCTGSTESGVTPTGVKISISYAGTQPGTCNGLASPGS